jgi:hypothetical protein
LTAPNAITTILAGANRVVGSCLADQLDTTALQLRVERAADASPEAAMPHTIVIKVKGCARICNGDISSRRIRD